MNNYTKWNNNSTRILNVSILRSLTTPFSPLEFQIKLNSALCSLYNKYFTLYFILLQNSKVRGDIYKIYKILYILKLSIFWEFFSKLKKKTSSESNNKSETSSFFFKKIDCFLADERLKILYLFIYYNYNCFTRNNLLLNHYK